eukprot:TRINITY_DN18768_c0_g1_i1.p1 TRINITY_DN18768_c0_g1~~TRINITY_DN18768_c0_g1_i1.p1  ORF type:complete len:1170 (-),score=265.90 TRINITY_DN18768_c0_g1_i1:42-3062(-)
MTTASGDYRFQSVRSGTYELTAAKDGFTFSRGSVRVEVASGSVTIAEPLIVSGFAVRGSVLTPDKEAVPNVQLQLFVGQERFATAESGATGAFTFENVPCGAFTIVPSYRGEHTTFNVQPSTLAVRVSGTTPLDTPFVVVGFSLAGRVIHKATGAGVAGATVLFNGNTAAVTDAQGGYLLDKLTAGAYSLAASLPRVTFAPLPTVRVSPSSAALPDIIAIEYQACATLAASALPDGLSLTALRVRFTPAAGGEPRNAIAAESDTGTEWCAMLPAGEYAAAVEVPARYRDAFIVMPATLAVTIRDAALAEPLHFQQQLFIVSGELVVIDNKVTTDSALITLERDGKLVATARVAHTGRWSFPGLLPGLYAVSASHPCWCWATQRAEARVDRADVTGLLLAQSGIRVPVDSTSAGDLMVLGPNSRQFSHELHEGRTYVCVPHTGAWTFAPKSCAVFDRANYAVVVSGHACPLPAVMEAKRFTVRGTIAVTSDNGKAKATIVVRRADSTEETVQTSRSAENEGVLVYEITAAPGDSLTLAPRSATLLFEPAARTIELGSTCPPAVAAFAARAGRFVSGRVTPSVEGAEIAVRNGAGDVVARLRVNEEGTFRTGPLDPDLKYEAECSAAGYACEREGKDFDFVAKKLASIRVRIMEEGSGVLAGVLVSISGVTFRSNTQTDAAGEVAAASLQPGQYFIKPLLREYTFAPATAVVALAGGEDHVATFAARRTLFSVIGTVRSLGGLAERGATVTARDAEGAIVDEAMTDVEGFYRLRGLAPGASYVVSVTAGASGTPLSHAMPAMRNVAVKEADTKDVDFVAVPAPVDTDYRIAGLVDARPSEILPSLTLHLGLEHGQVQGQSQSRGAGAGFFDFAGLLPQAYTLRVASAAAGSYATRCETTVAPLSGAGRAEVHPTAEQPRQYVRVTYTCAALSTESHELLSWLLVPVALCAAYAVYDFATVKEHVVRLLTEKAPAAGAEKQRRTGKHAAEKQRQADSFLPARITKHKWN